ncbi:MAG TPA: hypothetical protein VN843_09975 [Anaerolineales bacterium]|nr:hypothetical protein [Anaerolineales bacterium]
MSNHSSETPHTIKSTQTTINDALKRRALSLINNKSIDAQTRTVIRYGLEINDPWLPELVRRANAGETVLDNLNLDDTTEDDPSEEKLEALAEMICQGDDGGTKAVALLVLLAALENADDPKSLAKTAKHYAFTRCGEMNVYGMIDVQVAILERELFTHSPHLP